jgi:hypothetical protein
MMKITVSRTIFLMLKMIRPHPHLVTPNLQIRAKQTHKKRTV